MPDKFSNISIEVGAIAHGSLLRIVGFEVLSMTTVSILLSVINCVISPSRRFHCSRFIPSKSGSSSNNVFLKKNWVKYNKAPCIGCGYCLGKVNIIGVLFCYLLTQYTNQIKFLYKIDQSHWSILIFYKCFLFV